MKTVKLANRSATLVLSRRHTPARRFLHSGIIAGILAGIGGLPNTAHAERPDIPQSDRSEAVRVNNNGREPAAPAAKHPFELRWLELGVAPALEIGRGVFAAAVVSPSLTIRTWRGLRLGASATPAFEIIEGLEGCSTVSVCGLSRWRAGGRAEYQFDFGAARPWLAMEVGRESWGGTAIWNAGFPKVSGTRTVFTGQAGFDVVARAPHRSGGIGLFAGVNADREGWGIGAGLRLTLGLF